jgi:diguanylate cyclase (GGDEF)-like protein/PAS domain S-box-containing protein
MEPTNLLEQRTDALFWLTFYQAALGIAVVQPDGRFLRANPELCKYLGYTEEGLKQTDLASITHADDRDADLALARKILSGQIPSYRIEKRFIRSDGRLMWGLLSVSLTRDAEGKPLYVIVVIQDITERKQAQEELDRLRDRYATICENASDFISVHDTEGNYLYASAACLRTVGYLPGELVGTNTYNYFHPDDLKVIMDAYRALGESGSHGRARYRIRRKTGDYVWFETYTRPIAGIHSGAIEYLSISRPLRDEREMQASLLEDNRVTEERGKALEAMASRDDLTSLMNRRAIEELLAAKLASRRAATFPFGCLLVDVDHFQSIVDNHGYSIGDDILRQVGQILIETCRLRDFVARYTGDGFIAVLPNTDAPGTIRTGERILKAVETAYWPELPPGQKVTVSIGGTCQVRPTGMKLTELLELLDSQLQEAKELGRNRIVLNAREIARHLHGIEY